ncbi:hypothetical protein EMIHUDRAFT_54014, partial [Emiliania huxleyi CCMP1516]|uniref:Cleft lip and palate transmembrane protein 1 n=2 Tax=Emiliania huxleyi TaxID=2903 RepID=A0A0D3L0A3_EMIH1
YAPRLYVDELGLLGKHALPLSSDVGKEPPRLRLRLLPISLGRYRATRQLHTALGALQAASGMEAAEFDELRELLSEKRLYRFALMQLIGLLHVVFDALAFRNDVGFWKGREDLRGLSSRGVIFNAGSTLVIFLYLLDGDGVNSIVLATYAFSTALELWKLTKVVAMRRRARGAAGGAGGEGARAEAATERFDEVATRHLTWGLAPLVVGWALYALLHYPHASWRAASPPYSWLLGSLADAIYLFGFIAMTPQLFINYKAPRGAEMARDGPSSPKIPRSSSATRRVAHLPWRVLAYKAFNTFIDDAFALMVAMPTAHRVACLRDDLVFLVLLYQRRLYPVDRKRANEFGIAYERDEAD